MDNSKLQQRRWSDISNGISSNHFLEMPNRGFMLGSRSHLGEEQKAAILKEFKTLLQDILEPHHDDQYLIRWLKARDFDVIKAEKMIRESFKFRKKIGADSILNGSYEYPEVYRKFPLNYRIGFDKENSIVRFLAAGSCDYKGFVYSMTLKDIKKIFIHFLESDLKMMADRRKELKQSDLIPKISFIVDLQNLSLKKFYDKTVINYLIQILTMYQDNYPETLKTSYIINVPSYFSWVYNIFKPFMNEVTMRKIRIMTTNDWQDKLREVIDPKILPAFLGGDLMDPEGDINCSNIICWDCTIPESYYLNKRSEIQSLKHLDMKHATVAQRAVLQIPADIVVPGSVLKWTFRTKHYNIKFGLFYKSTKEKLEEVLPVDNVDCQIIPEENEIVCQKAGTYILYFDNSYSWMTAKHLSYKVEIDSPDVIGNNN